MKIRALSALAAATLLLGLIFGWSAISSAQSSPPTPYDGTQDVRPTFMGTAYDITGGEYDGKRAYLFRVWNRSGEALSLTTIPGSFNQPVDAFLATGALYSNGDESFDEREFEFAQLFGAGTEVLNPSPTEDFVDRPANFIAIVDASVDTLVFTLQGRTATASYTAATVEALNLDEASPIRAGAGLDELVSVGVETVLDGSDSIDYAGDELTYSWALVSAPVGSAALTDPNDGLTSTDVLRPRFTPDLAGDYVYELTVTGTSGVSTDTVLLSTIDVPPVADLGPDFKVRLGELAYFDLLRSFDVDGDKLQNPVFTLVEKPAASTTALNGRRVLIDEPGKYVISLQLEADGVLSNVDTVTISNGNVMPIADAGDDIAATVGETVTLLGDRSGEPNRQALTYAWSLISRPAGSAASISSADTPRTDLNVDVAGNYVAQLLVTDTQGTVDVDTVVISTEGTRPVANAGTDMRVVLPDVVTADGTNSSDANGDTITYQWSAARTTNADILSAADQASASYSMVNDRRHVLQLIVSDGLFKSAPDNVTFPTNNRIAPTAVPSVSGTFEIGQTITLDSSASIDINSTIGQPGLVARWALVHVPAGSTAALVDENAASTTFVPDVNGLYIAQLFVRDDDRRGFVSEPVTVSIEVGSQPVNDPPVFTSSPVLTATANVAYTYDADANDPEGGAVVYSLDQFPTGMVIDSVTGVIDWTPTLAGSESVIVRATDPGGAFATQSYTITVEPGSGPNLPPTLDVVADATAPLGATTEIQLVGTDPNGSLLTYSVTPLPLPAGASLDASTGLFTFFPSPNDAGQAFTLTFSVSDGEFSASQTATVTVGTAGAPGATALSGRVLDTNAFVENGTEVPIVGAVVSLVGTGASATTDANGDFQITGAPSGPQFLDIDTSGANPSPAGGGYTNFREGWTVIEGVDNVFERPFYLARLAVDGDVTVDPNATTILDAQSIGIRLEIPPQTIIDENGNFYTGNLTIAEIPQAVAPVELPSDLRPAYMISVQPAGLTFTQPAAITMPNVYDLLPGQQMQLWSFDPLRAVGILEVSADAQTMFTVQGGINSTTWSAPLASGAGGSGGDPDSKNNDQCCDKASGSQTAVDSGALSITHDLVTYQSVGQTRGVRLVYDSSTASPFPIVRRNASAQIFRPDSQQFTTQVVVGGQEGQFRPAASVSALAASTSVSPTFADYFDAGDLETGRYDYTLNIRSAIAFPNTPLQQRKITPFEGQVLVHNRNESSIGTGWGIDGLTKVTPTSDGVVITDGDGSISFFEEVPTNVNFNGGTQNVAGDFQPRPSSLTVNEATSPLLVRDVDDDNRADIVGFRAGAPLQVAMNNRTTGRFDLVQRVDSYVDPALISGNGVPTFRDVAFADFNEDGLEDFAGANSTAEDFEGFFYTDNAGNISIHLGQGGGFFTKPELTFPEPCDTQSESCAPTLVEDVAVRLSIPGNTAPRAVLAGDVDADSHQDLVVFADTEVSGPTRWNIHIYFGLGDGTFEAPLTIEYEGDAGFARLGGFFLEDLNGDGLLDIQTKATPGGGSVIAAQVFVNQTGRTFTGSEVIARPTTSLSGSGQLAGVADVTGDSKPDLIFTGRQSRFSNDFIFVAPGIGEGTFGTVIATDTGTSVDMPVVDDFNKDGIGDVQFIVNGGISVALGDGSGGIDTTLVVSTNFGLDEVAAGDLNGDEIPDLLRYVMTPTTGGLGPVLPEQEFVLYTSEMIMSQAASYVQPLGDFSRLTRALDGTYSRTLPGGVVVGYDAQGLQTTVTDSNGNQTIFGYSGELLTTITDPAGLVTTLGYTGGLLSTVTDPANRVTALGHDADGNLTSITDPDTSVRTMDYDTAGLIQSQTSKRGFVTQYVFDIYRRHVSSSLPDGSTRQIIARSTKALADPSASESAPSIPLVTPQDLTATFVDGRGATEIFRTNEFGAATERVDALNRVRRISRDPTNAGSRLTSPEGRVRTTVPNILGLPTIIRETASDGSDRTTSITYDARGFITEVVDGDGFATTISRDANGNPTTITDALNQTIVRTFNTQGQPLTQTDERGSLSSVSYDLVGNTETLTNAEGEIVQLVRDAAGNITSITDGFGTPDARTVSIAYDSLNRPTSVTDGEGDTTLFRYDVQGNLLETEDATGVVLAREYDALERATAIVDPAVGRTDFVLDAAGNIIQATNALGDETNYTYNLANELVTITDALGRASNFGYDLDGNLTSISNARGFTTLIGYDGLSRQITQTDPLGGVSTVTYDNRDNVVSFVDARSQTVTNTYDALSRITNVVTPDNSITLGYDEVGNLISAIDNDTTLSFTYDLVNRRLTATSGGSMSVVATVSSVYNERGLRTSLTDTLGGSQGYAYDLTDRLSSLTTNDGNSIGLTYDAAGRPTGVSFPNGVIGTANFGANDGRIASISYVQGVVDLYSASYGYNSVGSIASIDEAGQIGIRARQFTYDALQRLTSGGTTTEQETYVYDETGNRVSSHLSALHVTNDADRLLEDDEFTYIYDANGNLESQTAKLGGGVTTYTYDAQDQLTGISKADGTIIAYAYDALGRRTTKSVGAGVTRYVYDEGDILIELDGSSVVQARYAHGDRVDQPLAFERGGQEYYYHADHQGSIRQVSDSLGAIVNQYTYDSYGQFIERIETVEQIYGYTAREQDSESDLYFYRSRYYDPRTGRFTQQDKIGFEGKSINLYAYVNNSPVNGVDPNGQFGFAGAIIGGVAGFVSSTIAGDDIGTSLRNAAIGAAIGAVNPAAAVGRAAATGVGRTAAQQIARNAAFTGQNFAQGAAADLIGQGLDNGFNCLDIARAVGSGVGNIIGGQASQGIKKLGRQGEIINGLTGKRRFDVAPDSFGEALDNVASGVASGTASGTNAEVYDAAL